MKTKIKCLNHTIRRPYMIIMEDNIREIFIVWQCPYCYNKIKIETTNNN